MRTKPRRRLPGRVFACMAAFALLLGAGAAGAGWSPFAPVPAYAAESPDPGGDGGSAGPAGLFDHFVGTENGDITIGSPGGADGAQTLAGVIGTYKNIAAAITGILTVTMLILMLIQFTKLGAAGDNEMARKRAIMGILTTGIATALLGGATIVIGFFWNVLANTAA